MINDFSINSTVIRYALDAKLPTYVIIHDSQTTYICTGTLGIVSTATRGWWIQKIVDNGVTTKISFAEGNLVPNKIADDYLSYDYLPS